MLTVCPCHALLNAQRVLVPISDVGNGETCMGVVPVDVGGHQRHARHSAVTPANSFGCACMYFVAPLGACVSVFLCVSKCSG
jgi:hypothetical protein